MQKKTTCTFWHILVEKQQVLLQTNEVTSKALSGSFGNLTKYIYKIIIYTKSLACDWVQPPEQCLGTTPGTMSWHNPRSNVWAQPPEHWCEQSEQLE